ncbi:P-loop containing nucleoside triphosphate hydrolase protein [Mycena maculata]|uniref:P-loop containing nucleoside triphosphate hydrolase protein n=1 Tax=Mycena maculata TaxID=230809 RepID=A0AAD7JX73_9AGAR|nr:P-loop containing nucleoside triphosphate hydrolase protein [Mycena maculata]
MNSSLFSRRRGTSGRTSSTGTNGTGNGSGGSGSVNSTATTTISSGDYARRCRELMALDRDLRALGATTFFDLPSITVIGGQSAGKSSLVEAVSGINVPRDSGTCTRCPMECSMSSSAEAWSCDISLRFDYDAHGAQQETTTYSFGQTITDRNAVELWLRRAQAAILHPHLPYQTFYTKTEQELRNTPPDDARLPFSKNAVLVDLRDPTITDLSFVDLPGLIQNERAEVIEVVRDLAVSRIESENTLILVTIPMSDDMQNQQAARLAKDADPGGQRTIAVLTKPDILGRGATGSRQKWKDILEGKDHQLTHGYYCVRLPDDDERSRGFTRGESERRAAEYFDSTQPWRDIADRSRFGVPNLATALSRLLVARIEKNLPILRQKLNALLEQYNADLLQLPPPPVSEPAAEVLLRVTAFCRAFNAAVLGDSDDHKSFAQKNRRLYLQFKAEIRSTGPDFRPFAGHSNYQNPNIQDVEPRDAGVSAVELVNNDPLDLLDVRQVIADSVAWELPNHVPFGATKTLVLRFTGQWRAPSLSCFKAVVEASSQFLDQLMPAYFGQFTKLEEYIRSPHWFLLNYCINFLTAVYRNLTRTELEVCKDQALETLEKMLALEKLPLFTQNTNYFLSESKAWLTRYAAVRGNSSNYLLSARAVGNNHFTASTRAASNVIIEPWAEEREPFLDELILMSNVRAYWQIAYQRIIDYVPLLIEHEFNQRLAVRIEEILFENLLQGPDASTRMQDLLTEDPAISAKRTMLEGRIARLLEIKGKLDGLT